MRFFFGGFKQRILLSAWFRAQHANEPCALQIMKEASTFMLMNVRYLSFACGLKRQRGGDLTSSKPCSLYPKQL